MVVTLIKFGAEISAKDLNGRTALYFAVRNGHQDIINTLIANFSSCFVIDNQGLSLLDVTDSALLKMIIQKGKIYQILNRFKEIQTKQQKQVRKEQLRLSQIGEKSIAGNITPVFNDNMVGVNYFMKKVVRKFH